VLFVVVVGVILFSSGWQNVRAADGTLDATFGPGGSVVTNFSANTDDYGYAIAVQPDGKVIVAGQSGVYPMFHSALVRYNANGTLDSTFGNAGKTIATLDTNGDQLIALVLQPDGKIVAAGALIQNNFQTAFLLARFNPNGSVDQTFANGGSVVTTFGNQGAAASAVVLQPDGKIVVVGWSGAGPYSELNDFALARFDSNGSPDQSFGSGGKLKTHFDGVYNTGSRATAALLQSDGKLVVTGVYKNEGTAREFALARYNSNGSLDQTFGTAGKRTTSLGISDSQASSAVLQPDGKIVMAGYFSTGHRNHDFALARFEANGDIDSTFGNGGKVITDLFSATDDIAYDLTLQRDGKLLASGRTGQYPDFRFGLARYQPNGTLDQGFGTAGKVMTGFGGSSEQSFAAALQSDSAIVVAGYSINSSIDFVVARYHVTPHAAAPADFDGDGCTDFAVFRPANGVWYIQHASGSTLFTHFGLGSDIPIPEDFDGDGKSDVAVWRESNGTFYVLRSATNTFQAQPWGQLGDDPTVSRDYDGDGRSDFAVFRRGASAGDASVWYVLQSSNGEMRAWQWGYGTDLPSPADYDGDGKTDVSVKRAMASGSDPAFFYTLLSANNSFSAKQWGIGSDQTVPADYDGDGRADIAVWRPSNGTFYVFLSNTSSAMTRQWGLSSDRVVTGDYDQDGRSDFAVWRPGDGTFYINASAGSSIYRQWGTVGDVAVASYQVH
jgi:uncharacterized delta-60 repeat protein